MRHKIFTLLSLSILTLVLCMSLASATVIFSDDFEDGDLNGWTITGWTNPGVYAESNNQEGASLSRIISTSDFQSIVVSYERWLKDDWESDNNFTLSWSADGTIFTPLEEVIGSSSDTLPSDTDFVSKTFNLPDSANNNPNFEIKFECNTDATDELCKVDNISIEGTEIPPEPEEITECKLVGDNGNLKVKIKDITNKGISDNKFGDDTEWFPLEKIELEIEVENKGDEKIKDIVVGWGLYDVENEDWIIDDEENDFNLKDGDEETLIIKFQLDDIDEFEDGNDYVLYVWATGEDEEFDGDETCVMDSDSIEIIIENDFVVVDNIEVPEVVQCGAEVQVTADVWNIGEDNQDEVSVQIYSKDLGINKMIEIGDIDALEDEKLDALITIPKTTSEGWYSLTFYVNDEDGDLYENDYDDDKAEFKVAIKVEGSCEVGPNAVVSATLESGGEAGQELVVKATITNTGDKLASYVLTADSYSEWASSLNIAPGTVVLSAGESREVIITLIVNDDALGDKLFNLVVTSGGEEPVRQPVSVTIKESASGISGITGKVFAGEGNTYLWGIAILNIILVIIIIIVAIRVAGK